MSTNKLLFFNGDGYPYNFTYANNIWNGKLIFEPNSTDTFKNLTMYILEQVEPISFTNTISIINSELYNLSGMTITPSTTSGTTITKISGVNQSSEFYTKWIYGTNINKLYPISTIISFYGNINTDNVISPNGVTDFNDNLYTVIAVKKGAIMITSLTSNDKFNLTDADFSNLKIKSHNVISCPEYKRNLENEFSPNNDMKISLIGSVSNDGVYEIEKKYKTLGSIYDYSLSNLSINDNITVNLELLTDRTVLYTGNVNIYKNNDLQLIDFENGINSNLTVGTTLLFEDNDGNQQFNGDEYTIESFITEKYIGYGDIKISGYTEIDDDGKIYNFTNIIYNPNEINIYEQNQIYLVFSGNTTNNDLEKNNNITFNIDSITQTKISGVTYNIAKINKNLILTGTYKYNVYKILKSYEKTIAIVTSNSDNIGKGYNIRCLSTTNTITYEHIFTKDLDETIETFITKNKNSFNINGIDLYRINDKIIFESIYSGQQYYFKINFYVNNILIENNKSYSYFNSSSVYNYTLKDCTLTYEKTNISNVETKPFYADVTLNLSDDVQDYGFCLSINSNDYYIAYNDNPGTTSCTQTTIDSFINKWETVFNNIGLIIWKNDNHIYVKGVEPNVNITNFNVKVNKFSNYVLDVTYNKFMMITSNYLYSNNINFLETFTTGMIVSITGSNYPTNNKEYNIIGISSDKIELSYQGDMYSENDVMLNLITREYLRKPRETNLKDIYYRFRWEDENSDIFMYDLSGENLIPWKNNNDYSYIGPKPLPLNKDIVFLNKEPNNDLNFISTPYKQQTIFEELKFKLEKFDDDDSSILPKPMTVFFGYNSTSEGVHKRNLIIERCDFIKYSNTFDGINSYVTIEGNTLSINSNENINLLELGFETNKNVRFKFDDKNPYTNLLFEDWSDYIITNVTQKTITVNSSLTSFSTLSKEFEFIIEQLPETIAQLTFYGESESEDERLKSHMSMLGIHLTEDDEYIFNESDIKEEGINYPLLNSKRKEMMNVYPEIYNYVGSYAAIIKAMYFFGYDDLELYEYYRNLDISSPLYNSLKRVVVQDLLDRNIEGWSYSEELAKRIGYKKTNLLNLTYKITDENGNNTNVFSLTEVQIKLNGLKKWLKKWVVPVNSNIRDITGVAQNTNIIYRQFDPSNNIFKHKTNVSTETIGINYIATRNFNDSWLISVRFYNVNDFIPERFDLKVITYVKDENNILQPQTYNKIYKTDMLPYNFYLNWTDGISDKYMYIETSYYNENGLGRIINKMYRLEDGQTYYYDEFKNYVLVNNNFKYKYQSYTQNNDYIYINDDEGNMYIINK